MKVKSIVHGFASVAAAGVVAAGLGIGAAEADDGFVPATGQQAEAPEEIVKAVEQKFEEVEIVMAENLEAIAEKGWEDPVFYMQWGNLEPALEYVHGALLHVRMYGEGMPEPSKRIFDAFQDLMYHPEYRIQDMAGQALEQFVQLDEQFAAEVIPLFYEPYVYDMPSSRRMLHHINNNYPGLRDSTFDLIEDMLRREDRYLVGDAVFALEWYFDNVEEPTPHHERGLRMMEDRLEGIEGEEEWIQFRIMGGLENMIGDYGGFSEESAERIFATVSGLDLEDEGAIYLGQRLALAAPELMDDLMALSKRYLEPGHSEDQRAAGLDGIVFAGGSVQELRDEAVEALLPLVHDEQWGVSRYSISYLGGFARKHEQYRQQVFDLVSGLEVQEHTLTTIMLTLGYIGEMEEAYAQPAFDMATEILRTGQYGGFHFDSFDDAYAVEIVAAIGTAHEAFRAEAFEVLKGALEGGEIGGWYNPQIVPVIYDAMAEIGTVDEGYAGQAIDAVESYYTDKRSKVVKVSEIAMGMCNGLDHAGGVLARLFADGADAQLTDKQQEFIANVTDPGGCSANAEQREQERAESGTRIHTGFVFYN